MYVQSLTLEGQFSHSFAESRKFLCAHLKSEFKLSSTVCDITTSFESTVVQYATHKYDVEM